MLQVSTRYIAVGIEMGLSVFIGIWLGAKGDAYFGTGPVLLWIGIVVGLGAATKAVVDAAKRARKSLDKDEDESTKKD